MTNDVIEISNALFVAILHSVWQGCLLALLYIALSKRSGSSQTRYLLAITLFTLAPLLFVLTFLQTYLQPPVLSGQALFHESITPTWAIYFATAWIVGVMFTGGRYFFGWIWLRMVVVRTATAVPPDIQALFDASKRALRIAERVQVRASSLIRSPMVVGVVRPVVLLPLAMLSGVPANVLNAAFTHELLHLRRFDHVAILVQAAGETLLFYHPAVRWLSAEARRAREYRCDDDSIASIGDKFEYARALLMLEQARNEHTLSAVMMNGGDLMDRVKRILVARTETKRSRVSVGGLGVFAAVALMTYSIGNSDEPGPTENRVVDDQYTLSIRWLPPSIAQWQEAIEKAAAAHGVSADILALVVLRESGGDENAVSRSGARGLMQVMPRTGEYIAEQRGIAGYSADQLYDPEMNIDFGAWYLARQMQRFAELGDEPLMLAVSAYNAGPGAVEAYLVGDKELPEETLRYRNMLFSMLSEKDESSSATIESYMLKIRKRLPVLTAPVEGKITSTYGSDGGHRGVHHGVDIAASTGTPVLAPISGRVAATGEDKKRGKYVTVRHAAGVESHYFHLNDIAVEEGARINAGDTLGEVGNTGTSSGPHLHFEVREFGKPVSPELYGFAPIT